MVLHRQRKYGSHTVTIRGVLANFWAAPDGIKVSINALRIMFEPYENSWGTTVTLRTPRDSAAKETSLPTSSRILRWRTSPDNIKHFQGIV